MSAAVEGAALIGPLISLDKSEMTEITIKATVCTKVDFLSLIANFGLHFKQKNTIQRSPGAIGWLCNDLLFVRTVAYSNAGLYWPRVWENTRW